MEKVLIVSSTPKATEHLTKMLQMNRYSRIVAAMSGSEARRMMLDDGYDIVIINTPLPDEFGAELAVNLSETTSCGVLMLVKVDRADDVFSKVEDFGVFVVEKPMNTAMFYQAIKLISASRRRILGLKNENVRLQKKIEEIRLVDRAKCALIEYLGMTEAQAHRHIEKQAMDLRMTRREVAQGILQTYES
ncbi:ANTAR domain-containing protein [Fumia xinanensis]|uniref:Stage 0 sporulation protein A homolog n=1 Tax=Fumia xinanensis TaxID=2763659 RepID=A0A926E5M5_9FIRM|nr:ANTAR domain-containing protein [Fumia xinanensis]